VNLSAYGKLAIACEIPHEMKLETQMKKYRIYSIVSRP